MTDTIADMLTRIRNALTAKHDSVEVPASTVKKAIAQILVDEGYIKGFEVTEDGIRKNLKIQLKYGPNKQRVIVGLKRISRPGLCTEGRDPEGPGRHGRGHHLHVPRHHDGPRSPQAGHRR